MLLCIVLFPGCQSRQLPSAENSPDISGVYRAPWPGPRYDEVFICFRKANEVPGQYRVSLWKESGTGFRKFRDSMFGTWTHALLVPADPGWKLIWISNDHRKQYENAIFTIDSEKTIYLAENHRTGNAPEIGHILQYMPGMEMPEATMQGIPDPGGIYSYYHSTTGRVMVSFSRTGQTVRIKGRDLPAWSVSIVKEIPDFGFTPVREGLYGGSIKNDSYPLATVLQKGNDLWLAWVNPERPGRPRWNRITTVYADGSIGIGLNRGSMKYREDSVFERIAGPGTPLRPVSSLLSLPGTYMLTTVIDGKSRKVLISESGLNATIDGNRGILYALSAEDSETGSWPDLFSFFRLFDRNGRCYIRFYSFGLQLAKELAVLDFDRQGNFKIGREDSTGPVALALFTKTGPAVPEGPLR